MNRLVPLFLSGKDGLCREHTEGAILRDTAQFNVELSSNTAIARLDDHLALDVVTRKDRFGNETNGIVVDSYSCGELLQPHR